ncbi:MAG TPA: class I SAM-dependent methyltransferase [Thermoanaerobaculia bacterium]|nr:class I SAM-dependent methyltransferase [Thermoanaerobaculia bacterium]
MTTHPWGTQPEMFGPRHEHRLSIILRETRRLPTASRVLDAAVGLGQLAERLQQQGLRVFGIDAAFDAVLHVRRSSSIPVVLGDLTRLPFREGAFDGVTTGETLEHLDNDAGAVREIARILTNAGLCVATVPALRSLWSSSDDYYEHRRRYSREELSGLFRNAGMTIEKAQYWGFPVVLAYDTLFLLPMNKRRARRKIESDAALQSVARAGRSRALVGMVRAVFAVDRLFSFIPFGPGLLLVAQKLNVELRPHEARS